MLEDLPLLAIRVVILVAAVAAVAGPLLMTTARRQEWDRRVARAVVVADGGRSLQSGGAEGAPGAGALQRTFDGASVADGIRRAVLWLDTTPPARREIVIQSPLAIGSVAQADVAAIPAGIGLRFERIGILPAARTVPAGRLLTATGVRGREVVMSGDRTSARDRATSDPAAWPIDVSAPKADQPAVDAAVTAVLSQRVWAAPSDRRARLFVADVEQPFLRPPEVGSALFIREPWIATAIAGITRDRDLHEAASHVAAGLAAVEFTAAPMQTVAVAADGRPLVVASGSAKGLVVVSAARGSDMVTPLLLRAIANAIADVPDLQREEVVPIAEAVLQRWSRPAAPVTSPRSDTVERDDRGWLWIAALCLLAIESWMRRVRSTGKPQVRPEEQARVA
jgi:hypothetical protein